MLSDNEKRIAKTDFTGRKRKNVKKRKEYE